MVEKMHVTAGKPANGEAFREAMAGAVLGSAILFIPNVLPLVLGYAANLYDASPVQVGLLNSAYAAAAFVGTISAPYWLPHVRWRPVALVAALALAGLFAVSANMPGIDALIALFAAAGLTAAFVAAPGNGTVGRAALPARWFGVSATVTLGTAAVYALAVPLLVAPAFGPEGALRSVALFFLACAIGARWLARAGAQVGRAAAGTPWRDGTVRERMGLLAAFGALVLFVLPAVAYWIFVERIGTSYGLEPRFIGLSITVGIVLATLGAAMSAALARNLPLAGAAGLALTLVSYLFLLARTGWGFAASLILFNIAWGLMSPMLFSVIRRADFTGRIYVAAGAGVLIGNTIAGPPSGMIVEAFGFRVLLWTCIAITLTLVPPLVVALRAGKDRAQAGAAAAQ